MRKAVLAALAAGLIVAAVGTFALHARGQAQPAGPFGNMTLEVASRDPRQGPAITGPVTRIHIEYVGVSSAVNMYIWTVPSVGAKCAVGFSSQEAYAFYQLAASGRVRAVRCANNGWGGGQRGQITIAPTTNGTAPGDFQFHLY